ncbi:DUF4450 domain-containing protein [Pseudoduganella sp. UC29_106]|uniref:DUF4450 domain-containing protein n=1 Tax=Pseudoduganella sp. UC29_106 TaxID=3374553 RepID=UPI003757EC76
MKNLARAVCLVCAALAAFTACAAAPSAPTPYVPAAVALRPNLASDAGQPLRYRPDGADFVNHNGAEFFNRSLYGGHTAFRVDGGDKPEFLLYLPGRGGNLRLAVRSAAGVQWLHSARDTVFRYRPGELQYEIRDPALGPRGVLRLAVLAYARTEGLILRAEASGVAAGTELVWVYGGVNGERGRRDGDIGTESVPISQFFQFRSDFAKQNVIAPHEDGFVLASRAATIAGIVPAGATQHLADAASWNDLPALLRADAPVAPGPAAPVLVGRAPLRNGAPLLLSLQRVGSTAVARELDTYSAVTAGAPRDVRPLEMTRDAVYTRAQLPSLLAETRQHFDALRSKVRIDTPDAYINAAAGALNVAADALWDGTTRAIMHGAIAWRARLLGWRGPYALDALGWHDRARRNFDNWTTGQNTSPIPPSLPPADAANNLARHEAALHSNGDLSNSHYDMNMVFIDALFRHLLWTGDVGYAREVWPVIERHLAWERRLFRREFGDSKLPLYEAYATIWASDDIYYNGGGVAYSSAYNVYANRSAARIARLIGKDPAPYEREADLIAQAMRAYLWMPDQGAFAEYRDVLGTQQLHPSYGLWTYYHTIDSGVATPEESARMSAALLREFKPLPVRGEGVPSDAAYAMLPTTNWMPYSWSVNNVVMGENLHTALALWQAGSREDAFMLAKSALLASMFMGISPGNVGTMNYLDAYRRESQRDFADGAGVMSRALVEGLFGVRPDALSGVLTLSPGFPSAWTHASLRHPDLALRFTRRGLSEQWEVTQPAARFSTLRLAIPAAYSRVQAVTVDGKPVSWRLDRSAVHIDAPFARRAAIAITWSGAPTSPAGIPHRNAGDSRTAAITGLNADWRTPNPAAHYESIALPFNDRVTEIFKPGKYQTPRSPYVSLSLPAQGAGAWAGHVKALPKIDDTGLRDKARAGNGAITMPNNVPFATPGDAVANNILFTSQWHNYPREATIPLSGNAQRAYLLLAGSTNFMQSRIDNGEIIVHYQDGSIERLPLHNPSNWWPIDQDYFTDDYQFQRPGPIPPRIDLKTGAIRLQSRGTAIDGGAATALALPLNASKPLQSLTLRTLSNDVVIGLLSLTLER